MDGKITKEQLKQALSVDIERLEILSNVVDEISSDPNVEPLRGLFGPFHQPSLRSQIQACHLSGFGWGVMT